MNYSQLGSTDLTVSRLGLGTVQLGMPYGIDAARPPSDSTCIALIREALEAGINYIDTASAYGNSESLVGRACAGRSPEPIICTKVSMANNGQKTALIRHLHTQLDTSRRLLNRDVLPLVKLHSQQGAFTFPALFEAMETFTARGWVQHWGVTTYGSQAPPHALGFPEHFRALQIPFNVLDRSAEDMLLSTAMDKAVGIVARSAFLQGILTDRFDALPPALEPLQPALHALRCLAEQANLSMAEMAFRYVAHQPAINTALFGTVSAAELRTNIFFFNQGPLPDDLLHAIRSIEVTEPRLLNPSTWQQPIQPSNTGSSA